ncbi:putative RNA-directed DNA polymerase from transposon X-element [Trichonephila clavipes]|nr:putative RNA-directed DNA polymerase from transposon X-element [Trichonephila clavipes]
MTHSETPFVQVSSNTSSKRGIEPESSGNLQNSLNTKQKLNRIQNKIKNVVQYRQQVWEDYLTSLDAEDGSLWGTARAFRKKASPDLPLNGPNDVALSDTNKTELIALSLESQFRLNDIHNHKDDIITNTVDAYIANHTNNNNIDPIPPLPSELITNIKKIKIKKSPGRDGITNKMIKNLPLITVFKITNIINNMFNLRYFRMHGRLQ